jgi:glycosyltransferase involved in cell wall biosynthesis
VRYLVVGEGPERCTLGRLTDELNLADSVTFLGHIPENEKIELYDLCDCHIMLSRQVGFDVEGYGISFDEAALRCKPSVGSFHGGVPEAVEHETTGFLVPCDAVAEASVRLSRLLLDRQLSVGMGRAGRQRVLARIQTQDSRAFEEILSGLWTHES